MQRTRIERTSSLQLAARKLSFSRIAHFDQTSSAWKARRRNEEVCKDDGAERLEHGGEVLAVNDGHWVEVGDVEIRVHERGGLHGKGVLIEEGSACISARCRSPPEVDAGLTDSRVTRTS